MNQVPISGAAPQSSAPARQAHGRVVATRPATPADAIGSHGRLESTRADAINIRIPIEGAGNWMTSSESA